VILSMDTIPQAAKNSDKEFRNQEMPISPARLAAFEILRRVTQQDAYAAELLHSSTYSKLSPADHGLATELVMGVLRWQSSLDDRISQISSQKLAKLDAEVLISLRMAVYQLWFLDRVPEHAAVHESVELIKRAKKRSAVPFVNAILRKVARASRPHESEDRATAAGLAKSCAHPQWLVERWAQIYGFDSAQRICAYDQTIPATSIRASDHETLKELESDGIQFVPGRLVASARIVLSGDVTRGKAFLNGLVSIQDEGSQLVALLAGHGEHILDCCAAPGGKTRILAERNPQSRIMAVELHPHRARLLRNRVPLGNVEVVTGDVSAQPGNEVFDLVLADVPCSGTGTLARNPEIKWRLQPEDLRELAARQLKILQSAMGRVAPLGRLVYSTCSLEPEENQMVVEAALGSDSSFGVIETRMLLRQMQSQLAWDEVDSLTSGPYLRTIPGVHPCDGFFAAVLARK